MIVIGVVKMIRMVMIEEIMNAILTISKEESVNTLFGKDLLLAPDAARPRGRDELFGGFSPRLLVCTWMEWSVCVCERERGSVAIHSTI